MKTTDILFLYIFFLIIFFSLCVSFSLFIETASARLVGVHKKRLVFAKQGRQTRRQAAAQAHIIADNFTVVHCI